MEEKKGIVTKELLKLLRSKDINVSINIRDGRAELNFSIIKNVDGISVYGYKTFNGFKGDILSRHDEIMKQASFSIVCPEIELLAKFLKENDELFFEARDSSFSELYSKGVFFERLNIVIHRKNKYYQTLKIAQVITAYANNRALSA